MKINRRSLILGTAVAGALTVLPRVETAAAAPAKESWASLIDLSLCDGCEGKAQPLCVIACRTERHDSFPEPAADQLRDYWPQKKHEDWSDKRNLDDRFTPYNWLFIQRVKVGNETISIPRRCMHCDNPPCAKLCPFGVNHKTPEGPVYINENLCFGGAKCRTVCPWSVPQRQAGVGLYTLWQKILPVGGGVMYKCDLCRARLSQGEYPFCMEACPRKAMRIGKREQIIAEAIRLKEEYQGDLYGVSENGGTSTIYVSKVKFSEINQALISQSPDNSKVVQLHKPENMLDKQSPLAALSLISPVAGAAAAYALSRNSNKTGAPEK